MKKLLLVGSNSIHTFNYLNLIKDFFDEILLLTDSINKNYNFNCIKIDFRLKFNILKSISLIKNIIKNFKPSVIHIHQANSYAFLTLLASKNFNIPKVLTVWGSDVLILPTKNLLLKKIVEYNLKKADIITADSLYVAKKIKDINPYSNVKLANFGVNIDNYNDSIKENIIYTNRLHKKLYNIDKIITSFSKFIERDKNWRLVIAGIGEETEKLKSLVSKLNISKFVEFTGWINKEKNFEFYKKAKIFVSIPSSDATSISLIEAISFNCICFVSNLPANTEHILHGINGFIETNLENIDFNKYKKVDIELLKKVNNFRRKYYSKFYNQKIFIKIYNELIK